MQLCAVGGVVDWKSVEESIDPEIMDWWLAFDHIDPIGAKRADQRIATMTSWLWAAFTGDARPTDDFLCVPRSEPDAEFDEDAWQAERQRRIAAEQDQFR